MSFEKCEVCLKTTRYACSENDSKRDQHMAVLRCPNSSRSDKIEAMEVLGFPTDWIEQ